MENKEDLIKFLRALTENEDIKADSSIIRQAANCGFIEKNNLKLTPIGHNYLVNNSACL